MSIRHRRPKLPPSEELLAYQGRVVNVDHSHREVAAVCRSEVSHTGEPLAHVLEPRHVNVVRPNILDPLSPLRHESGALFPRGPVCFASDNDALLGRIDEGELSTYTNNRGNEVKWQLVGGCAAYREITLNEGPLAGAVVKIAGTADDQVIRSFEAKDGSRFDMDERGGMNSAKLTHAGLLDFARAVQIGDIHRKATQFYKSVAAHEVIDHNLMDRIAKRLLGGVYGAVQWEQRMYEIVDGRISVVFPIDREIAFEKHYIPKTARNALGQYIEIGVLASLDDVRILFDLRNPTATTAVARWRPIEGEESILDVGRKVDDEGLLSTYYMYNNEKYWDDYAKRHKSDIRWRVVKGTELTGDPVLGWRLRNGEDTMTFNFISSSVFILLLFVFLPMASELHDDIDRTRTYTLKQRQEKNRDSAAAWLFVGILMPVLGAWFSAEAFLAVRHLA